MERPLTFRAFFATVAVFSVVFVVAAGYLFTTLRSQFEDLEYQVKRIEAAIEQNGVCQRAAASSSLNQERLKTMESKLEEAQSIVDSCLTRIKPAE